MSDKKIKVTIVVHGKFQAFMLARVLEGLGYLHKIITTIPKFKLRNEKIPNSKIRVIISPYQIIERLFSVNATTRIKECEDKIFSLAAAILLYSSNIIYGFAGYSLESAKMAKKRKDLFILDRACPHVEYQEQLVREEAEKLQVKSPCHTKEWVERCLKEYELADKIVVPSNYTLNSFIERGVPASKLYKIPLIGKNNILSSAEINKRKKKDNIFRVCAVGNLFRKGTIYLLEAWNKLKLKNAELLLRASMKQLTSSKVIIENLKRANNIKILPYFKDINDFYLLGDIFCFPSVDDGFGMALIEAMACKLPVITTKNTGASEYIRDGEHGFIVSIRDPEAIAQKIEKFYSNRELVKEFGEKAYLHVKSIFNKNVYKMNVKNFFDSLEV